MMDSVGSFDVLASIQKHIGALKPLLPKQALVCIGEYPIKNLLKDSLLSSEVSLPIFIEKSTGEIYNWLPKGYNANLVLGFEDKQIDTHFWYDIMPTILLDDSVVSSLIGKSPEKLQGAILFASVWDGLGSAVLPALIGKFKAANLDTLSLAVLPSKIQPIDAQFNAYAALKICGATEGATVLLMGRDQLDSYEGVDRKGQLLKGDMAANYLLNMFLAKESLVKEISELSRTFGAKMFAPIVVTGASYKVYGSVENMLNAALLKPLLDFDLSSATLLYAVLRLPRALRDVLPRGKIELAITNWFKQKTTLQSIIISEPIYTDEFTDRIDAALFVGGFDMTKMLSELEEKILPLKIQAVEKGFMTADGSFIIKFPEKPAEPSPETPAIEPAAVPIESALQVLGEPTLENQTPSPETVPATENPPMPAEYTPTEPLQPTEPVATPEEPALQQEDSASPSPQPATAQETPPEIPNKPPVETVQEPKPSEKPKRIRKTKKSEETLAKEEIEVKDAPKRAKRVRKPTEKAE